MPDPIVHELSPEESSLLREMISDLEEGYPNELVVQEMLKTGVAEDRIRVLLEAAIRTHAQNPKEARSISREA